MARLTRDEAFRLASDLEEFLHELVGQDVVIVRQPNSFSITALGAKARKPRRKSDLGEGFPDLVGGFDFVMNIVHENQDWAKEMAQK